MLPSCLLETEMIFIFLTMSSHKECFYREIILTFAGYFAAIHKTVKIIPFSKHIYVCHTFAIVYIEHTTEACRCFVYKDN